MFFRRSHFATISFSLQNNCDDFSLAAVKIFVLIGPQRVRRLQAELLFNICHHCFAQALPLFFEDRLYHLSDGIIGMGAMVVKAFYVFHMFFQAGFICHVGIIHPEYTNILGVFRLYCMELDLAVKSLIDRLVQAGTIKLPRLAGVKFLKRQIPWTHCHMGLVIWRS